EVPVGTRLAESSDAALEPRQQAAPITVADSRLDVPAGTSPVSAEHEGREWTESHGARRADALRLLAESYLAGGWRQLSAGTPMNMSADRYQVVVHIDQALLGTGSLSRPHRCA